MFKRILCVILALLTSLSLLTACDSKNKSPIPEQYQPQIPEGEEQMIDSSIIKSTLTSTDDGNGNYSNPVIFADVPDVDFIRVGDAYYMVSTTMHLSPGCPIMKSYDLVNWEIVNYVYNTLADADNVALRNGEHNYGKGQWASTIRYHEGTYYVSFLSYSTGKTYMFYTNDIENGKFERYEYSEWFHDMSLLFDDDGKVYLIYGGGQIWCVELSNDLSTFKPETKRVLIQDAGLVPGCLAEGAHAYKIDGYYYIFIITWPPNGRRTQLVYRSESLDGEWEMKVLVDDNLDFHNAGVAQGGIIDTADGDWYCILFQDHGAVGRAPVLMPMTWVDGWPVVEDQKPPKTCAIPVPGYDKKSIVTSDEFINSQIVRPYHNFAASLEEAGENDYNGSNLLLEWQWNHNPDNRRWSLTAREGYLRLITGLPVQSITEARNTLSQRTFGPECSAYIKMDITNMKNGDVAGLSAFAERYGYVGVKKKADKYYVVMARYDDNDDVEKEFEIERVEFEGNEIYLRVDCDFVNSTDKAYFYYSNDGESWTRIGDTLQMNYFGLHFMGYRYAIFNYATTSMGGYVDVDFFRIDDEIIR